MSSVAKTILSVVALVVALAPAASAIGFDTGSHSLGVSGQSAGTDTRSLVPTPADAPADASAQLGLATSDSEVSVEGPRCAVDESQLRVSDMQNSCSAGNVAATLPNARLDYNVNLRLDQGNQAAAGSADTASTAALTASDLPLTASPTAIVVAAAAAGSLGLAYLLWRAAKLGLLGAFIPLASHIRDDELLEDNNRRAIYELIRAEPGIATKELAERLNLAWGTVTHHLTKLERRRFVVSKKYGKYRRYFINGGSVTPEDKDKVAVLKVARTADVAEYIRAHPGKSQKEVSESLGVSSSTVLWHVKRLIDVQAITRVRDGKEVRYFPGPAQSQVIVPPQPAETHAFHA